MKTIPDMPIRQAPHLPLVIYTVLMAAITLAFLTWWAISSERRRGPALPLLLVGGALSGFMEPWLDNVVLVGWPLGQVTPTFHAYERFVPIFVIIGYAWFCGGPLYVLARIFERRFSTSTIWALYGAVAIVDFVAIGLSGCLGILQFYGDPPFMIAGFPIWWAAIDGLNVVLGGTPTFFLFDRLHGIAYLWLILIPSVVLGAAAGIVSWPISTALHSAWPSAAKYMCALVSIGLSLACVHLVAQCAPRIASRHTPAAQGNSAVDVTAH